MLDMPAMIAIARQSFKRTEEPRSRKHPTHSLDDCGAVCLSMFHFRDESLRVRTRLGSWKSVWEALRILVRYVEVDD